MRWSSLGREDAWRLLAEQGGEIEVDASSCQCPLRFAEAAVGGLCSRPLRSKNAAQFALRALSDPS